MSAAQPDDLPPDAAPAPVPAPPVTADRADWLVGADEGLAAEMERAHATSGTLPRPTLLRPSAPAAPAAPLAPPPVPVPMHRPAASPSVIALPVTPVAPVPSESPRAPRPGAVTHDAGADDGFERGPGNMVWEPGARSVPALQRDDFTSAVPEPTHDFPMDDAEERARNATAYVAAPAAPRPHEVVAPEAFNVTAAPMPWWIAVAHTLRTDRRIQVLLGVVMVVLATVALWPRGERPRSIGSLRHNAISVDGLDVKVAGKVGQVFKVGGGYAFYLLDGRDTLVVFTRTRHPEERQHVTVRGTMSTGFLDGQSTLALFESNAEDH